MKKTLTLLALIITCVGAAHAMPPKGEGKGPMCPHMMTALNLTEEQSTQVKVIMDEKRAKIRAVHEETRSRMAGVLNEEQMKTFEMMHKQHKGKWHHGMEDGKDPKPDCPYKDKKPKGEKAPM